MEIVKSIPEQKELTPELAKQLLIDSFRLSQGDLGFQELLLGLVFQLNPSWKINRGAREFRKLESFLGSRKVIDAVHQFRTSSSHPARDEIQTKKRTREIWKGVGGKKENALPGAVEIFLSFLSGEKALVSKPDEEARECLYYFIERDLYFFHVGQEPSDVPPRRDSYFINFIIPGVMRKGLRTSAFKGVCDWIEKNIRLLQLTSGEDRSLQEIQNWHNKASRPEGSVDVLRELKRA